MFILETVKMMYTAVASILREKISENWNIFTLIMLKSMVSTDRERILVNLPVVLQ